MAAPHDYCLWFVRVLIHYNITEQSWYIITDDQSGHLFSRCDDYLLYEKIPFSRVYFVASFIFPIWVSNNRIFHVCDDACAIQRNTPCMWTAPRFSLWSFWYITVEKEQSSVTGSTNFSRCWRMICVCRICVAGRGLEFRIWPFVSGTLVDYHCEPDPQRWSAWLCRQCRPFYKWQRLVYKLSLYIDVVVGRAVI
jgi:hypothetical protein